MKRAVLCVINPQDYIDQLGDYSIMIINPNTPALRLRYLLDNSDYSLLITDQGHEIRPGQDYGLERLYWYTSGTTGDSKFCSFTQVQLDLQIKKICDTYQISANDRYVSVMPLWHAHGQGMYWAAKAAKCDMNFINIKHIKQLSKYQPTFISAIPDFLGVIGQFNFDHLRFIRSCSSAMPIKLYQQLKQKYQVPVIEAFGMTEALSHCFTNPLYGEQRVGTIGMPDGIEADIIDGQLHIKGPSVFCNDWYATGDLAEQDPAGYYKILGRSKDQITVKGIKLNPVSLETQLHSAISNLGDCVIFGTTFVKCLYTGSCDPEKIQNFLASLGQYCWPRVLEKVNSIPISPSGKISRSWLNNQY